MFDTILKMLFTGRAAVPRHGMKTISQQLGSRLPSSSIHLQVPVRSVTASAVRIDSGEVDASAVVVATDGNSAAELLGRARHTAFRPDASGSTPPKHQPIVD